MTRSVMDPPPNPHRPCTGLPLDCTCPSSTTNTYPLLDADYERLVDVHSILQLLVTATCGQKSSCRTVQLDQEGLGCLLGRLSDDISTVLDNCEKARRTA